MSGTIEDFAAGGLKSHNSYRSKHHDDNLVWSDTLAAKAQKLAEALADKKSLEIAKDLEKEGMGENVAKVWATFKNCLLYTSPSPRDKRQSRMPSSA